ncbi:MAG: LamG-like jellyroll fold domain-containing protein [Parcubacteria group bacterium]
MKRTQIAVIMIALACTATGCINTRQLDPMSDDGSIVADGTGLSGDQQVEPPKLDGGCVKSNGGVEICDGQDNDCDGLTDDVNPVTLQNDTQNCGKCGNVCSPYPYAIPDCLTGNCGIICVSPDRFNADGNMQNGCECLKTGEEVCGNGKDDDCDGKVDGSPCWDEVVSYDFSKTPASTPMVVKNTANGGGYDGYVFGKVSFGQTGSTAKNAAAFSGGYIQVGTSEGNFDSYATKYTFSLYFEKLSTTTTGPQVVLGTGFGCMSPKRAWSLNETAGVLTLTFSKNGTDQHYLYDSTKKVVVGKWYQVEIVMKGGTITLTVDGKDCVAVGSTVFQTSKPLLLSKNTCAQPSLMGRLADFQIHTWK